MARAAPRGRRPRAREETGFYGGDSLRIDGLRQKLLAWYRGHRRDLPWRRTRDPYAIWISEIMLQQTRVETVVPYFARFLARFPTVNALAAAPIDDVLALWSGLGYYARGRNLHRAAVLVALRHDGALPRDDDALQALPGIGRYTAGAIRSIAFDEPAPILDGNVVRVLTRVFAKAGNPKTSAVAGELWALAARFAAGCAPGEVNQGLMELGATVCTPVAPDCHVCPWRGHCAAREAGETERFPELPVRKVSPVVHGVAAFVTRGDTGKGGGTREVLLAQRAGEGLLGGLWELPYTERELGDEPADALAQMLSQRLGVAADVGERVATVTHVFTHKKLLLAVYRCTLRGRPARSTASARWSFMRPTDLVAVPLSRLMARALAAAGVPVPAQLLSPRKGAPRCDTTEP